MKINVHFTGRSYHMGTNLPTELELSDNASLQDALAALQELLGEEQALPASCLVAVGSQHLGTIQECAPCDLRDGDELVLIAPVAGG